MGGNVQTFLSKFIIVWVDRAFDPEDDYYEEMMDYVNELNSYNFTKCRTFLDSKAAVKLLDGRSCAQTILISSGAFCKFKDDDGFTLLDRINKKTKAKKRIIDHIIYCGDEDAYTPI